MAAASFRGYRLFLPEPLAEGLVIVPTAEASHYLRNVLRLAAGARVLVFNGRDGEWSAALGESGKRGTTLTLDRLERAQETVGTLQYLFAPLKSARLDYMVQKAVEMGAARLTPVITARTQVSRVNLERMRANAIEAAEQCGLLSLPEIDEPVPLGDAVAALEDGRHLVFCDEDAPVADPLAALRAATRRDLAVLIGPEGGFTTEERAMLNRRPFIIRLSLGPRILRADTAAVAALTLVQAVCGDLAGEAAATAPSA